jgi:hypothetical protein
MLEVFNSIRIYLIKFIKRIRFNQAVGRGRTTWVAVSSTKLSDGGE